MNLKNKIMELRKLILIPIKEAKEILISNELNVEKSFETAKLRILEELKLKIGLPITEIEPILKDNKYDINKTVIYFKKLKEDEDFNTDKLVHLNDETLEVFESFIKNEDLEGLKYAILVSDSDFEKIYHFLIYQLELIEFSKSLKKMRDLYLKYYNDNLTIVECIELWNKNDISKEYANTIYLWNNNHIKLEENYSILIRNYKKTKT